jgi:hypothetical protein
LNYKYFSCWSCGKLPALETFALLLRLTYPQARQLLGGIDSEHIERRVQVSGKLKEPDGLGPLLKPHKDYLKGRGFKIKELEELWKIKGIGHLHARLAWRIYIPILADQRYISWTTRTIGSSSRRYISAEANEEAVSMKQVLYGGDYCQHSVMVCEGPTDVWRIGKGAVSLLGTEYTRSQVLALSVFPRRFICFDNVPEAQKRAKKLANDLSVFDGETRNIKLDAKDAASASEKEVQKLRAMLD